MTLRKPSEYVEHVKEELDHNFNRIANLRVKLQAAKKKIFDVFLNFFFFQRTANIDFLDLMIVVKT